MLPLSATHASTSVDAPSVAATASNPNRCAESVIPAMMATEARSCHHREDAAPGAAGLGWRHYKSTTGETAHVHPLTASPGRLRGALVFRSSSARPRPPTRHRQTHHPRWMPPIDAVWKKVGGYCDITKWLPGAQDVRAHRAMAISVPCGAWPTASTKCWSPSASTRTRTRSRRPPGSTIIYHGTLEAVADGKDKTKLPDSLIWDQAPARSAPRRSRKIATAAPRPSRVRWPR